LKVYSFSDTHGVHKLLEPYIPEDADILIFSGDCSNYKDAARNSIEVMEFFDWYESLSHKYKIWIAGNHCTSIERGLVKPKEIQKTTTYLQDEEIIIEGIKIYASPWTPTFGEWAFMKSRGKLAPIWNMIPNDTDILVTHGPCYGILDISENRDGTIEFCGDKELLNRVVQVEPKYMLFGHIHDHNYCINQGMRTVSWIKTIFMNSSVVEDGKFGQLSFKGNTFEI
jgi:Icc-related predicted phosphoesterase